MRPIFWLSRNAIAVIFILTAVLPSPSNAAGTQTATPRDIRLPAFDGADYACDGLRRAVLQRQLSPVNGGTDVILYDQGGAEYMGDPAGLVSFQAQSLITVAGRLTILPCSTEGGPSPVVIQGSQVRFRVDDARRLVYVDGFGSISQGNVTTKLTKARAAIPSAPNSTTAKSTAAKTEPEATIPSNATLQVSKHFLLLEEGAAQSAASRHVMVLRHSLVESMAQQDPASTYEQTAADIAGILYAAKDGQAVEKSVLAAAGKKVAAIAAVQRFAKASELLASVGVPDGWNEAIVAVTWRGNAVGAPVDAPASAPAQTTPPPATSTTPNE